MKGERMVKESERGPAQVNATTSLQDNITPRILHSNNNNVTIYKKKNNRIMSGFFEYKVAHNLNPLSLLSAQALLCKQLGIYMHLNNISYW